MLKKGCFANPIAYNPQGGACIRCNLKKECSIDVVQAQEVLLADMESELVTSTASKRLRDKLADEKAFKKAKLENIKAGMSTEKAEAEAKTSTQRPELEIDFSQVKKIRRLFERRSKPPMMKANTAVKREVEALEIKGINLSLIKENSNPIPEGCMDYLRIGIDFIIHAKAFTKKDIQEYYSERMMGYSASTSRQYAQRVVDILKAKELITQEGRGLYCLV